ncbi:hypothetical protein ACFL6Y_05635 [Elusimicrobiota bacterium]
MTAVKQWDCCFCGTQNNDSDRCAKCDAEIISCYRDKEAVEDGILIDLEQHWHRTLLPQAPNGLIVNRCTGAVFHAFTHTHEDGTLDCERLWKAMLASMEREDEGWFKGNFEDRDLWLLPNEVNGVTLMLPEDY